MKLYKNVDICDLNSIIAKGILSLNEAQNNNWESGKRANNSKDVVYLFKPISEVNSFPNYGLALIECNTNATENNFRTNDVHKNDYKEYIVGKVKPEEITTIYLPKIFQNRIESEGLSEDVLNKVIWCEIEADVYDEDYRAATETELLSLAQHSPLNNSWGVINFFRGEINNKIIDYYNVKYRF